MIKRGITRRGGEKQRREIGRVAMNVISILHKNEKVFEEEYKEIKREQQERRGENKWCWF